jgi:phage terminase large subunit
MEPGEDCTLAAGGNGAGKTEMGSQIAAAVCMGANDSAVQIWMKNNSIRPDLIPPEGGTVLASSLNASLSIHVQRAAIKKYLPPGTEWRNEAGPGTSVATLPNQNKVIFVTNDSGARSYQGFSAALCWLDEEHDESVYNEALQRVSRVRWSGRSGWLLLTMTPLKGLTSWVYKRFVETPDPGTKIHYIHGGDNPYIDQAKRERILRSYGQHERAARDKGEFTAMEGLVYQFDRRLHVCEAFDPPADWKRFGSIDFGVRNPFCYLLAAMDPSDSVLHLYRCHYRREWTLRQHLEAIREITDVEPEWVVADCEDRGSRLTLSREYDYPTLPSKKGKGSVRAGLNRVHDLMNPDCEGRPHLVIHDHPSMNPVIHEFQSYRWDTTKSKRDQPDNPLKKDDHAMDCVRYLCSTLALSTFAVG